MRFGAAANGLPLAFPLNNANLKPVHNALNVIDAENGAVIFGAY